MKRLFLLLIVLLVSCQKDEIKPLFFPYDANQPEKIVANVFIMEHSIVTFESMEQEVNADYYHRYGIHVELHLKEERASLSDEVKFGNRIFIPKKQDTVSIYVVPQQYINISGAAAYAVVGNRTTVIGDRYIRNRTLAHEIGHIYGLDHVEIDNNVMTPFQVAKWKERPNDFEDWQIDTILEKLKLIEDSETGKTQELIIDYYE